MADGIELGKAYVQIVPSAQGIKSALTEMFDEETDGLGEQTGQSIGQKLVGTLKNVIVAAGIGKIISDSINMGVPCSKALAAWKRCSRTVPTRSRSTPRRHTGPWAFPPTTTWSRPPALRPACCPASARTPMLPPSWPTWPWWIWPTTPTRWARICRISRTPISFAKQNYTMLDNLKLGYGGTQAEMQRLLNDATKISGVKYDLGNLADMYSAIHIIQQEMDITGTTAKEAATTLTGSFAAMKAAAENVMGNWSTGADLTEPLQALADTAQTFLVDNLLPMIGNVLAGIPEIVYSLVPELLQTGTELLSSLAQASPRASRSSSPPLCRSCWHLQTSCGTTRPALWTPV